MKLVSWQLERIMVEVLVFGIVTPVLSASIRASKVTNVQRCATARANSCKSWRFRSEQNGWAGETSLSLTCWCSVFSPN